MDKLIVYRQILLRLITPKLCRVVLYHFPPLCLCLTLQSWQNSRYGLTASNALSCWPTAANAAIQNPLQGCQVSATVMTSYWF